METIVKQNNNFFQELNEYVSKNNPNIAILTPCYGGVCYVNYVHSLMTTIEACKQHGISITIEFCKNDSLVSRARNNLIAKAMNNRSITHFLFIDSDITWSYIDIFKLLMADKYLIGGVYPLKKYNWENLINKTNPNENIAKKWIDKKNNSQLKDIITNEDVIQYNMLKYNVNFLESILKIDKNLAKVKHIATGFMLIKRETIENMIKAYPQTKYVDDVGFLQGDENEFAYALFDCGVEEGHYFSEDWLFCHRWTKMGGNVYLDVSINLTHTGTEDFKGSFVASILN
jgi:hypothetical protein